MITGHTRVTRSGYCEEPQDRVGFLIDVISREKCDTFLTLPPLLNKMVERVVSNVFILKGSIVVSASLKSLMFINKCYIRVGGG